MSATGWRGSARATYAGLLGLTLALLAVSAAAWLKDLGRGTPPDPLPFSLVAAVVFGVLGMLVVPRAPRSAVGWLFLAIGVAAGGAAAAGSWAGVTRVAWFAQWTPWLAYGLLPLPLLLFPDGRLPTRRWRWVLAVAGAGVVVPAAALAVAALDAPRTLLTEVGTSLTPRTHTALLVAAAGVLCSVTGAIGTLAALWSRWRHASGELRQQVKWLGVGAAVGMTALVFETASTPGAWVVAALAVPIAAGIAILKHRLYDVDLFLRRSVVYAILTVFVVLAYSLFANLLEAVFEGWQGRSRSVAATAAVAAAFHPVQVRVQRAVDRFLFGDRSDPYTAVSRLGENLDRRPGPTNDLGNLLRGIAEAVADALHLPYVALHIGQKASPIAAAEHGRRAGELVAAPMTHYGRIIGELVVSPRSRHEDLSAVERRLLGDLARQAGLAAHAVMLSIEVQRARERLVRTREEERRRLRRDLHDGLGAALAGLRMQVSTAPYLLKVGDIDAVQQLLARLEDELGRYTVDIRHLIEGLSPAALEQIGLPGAVRRAALPFQRGTHPLHIDVIAAGVPEQPGQLPAAVETAAYHISIEALSNAARHAHATTCQVRLVLSDRELTVEVADDGRGLQPGGASARHQQGIDGTARGVGLSSMQERATELGGTFLVDTAPSSGLRVLARLPLTLD